MNHTVILTFKRRASVMPLTQICKRCKSPCYNADNYPLCWHCFLDDLREADNMPQASEDDSELLANDESPIDGTSHD